MMELRSLHYVVTLARRLSFARAAEDLGISQPALTRAVQTIEQRFGVRLFDRDRSGVRLTTQGQIMVDAAAVLVANAQDLERHWDRTARGQSGVVRFGMAPMPARALLTSALQNRLRDAPDVRNDVVVRNVDVLWPLLIAGDIEFFVAAEGQVPESPPVRSEILGRFPVSFIVRPGHPLLQDFGRQISGGGQYPVLVSSRNGMTLPHDLAAHANGPPHVVEDFAALAEITAATDAIWQSSAFAVAGQLDSGTLCALERAGEAFPQSLRMMLYSLDHRTQSAFTLSLVQVFRQRIRSLESA